MKLPNHRLLALLLSLTFLFATALHAQITSQTIPLRQGWNAIFLEVHPETNDCETVFAGIPVESVWGWNRRFSPVQFIADPNDLLPKRPDWLVYLPPGREESGRRNLFTVEGGKCYLVKLPPGAPSTNLMLRGRPSLRKPDWVSDSFNLVGFNVDANPRFTNFFGPSLPHVGQKIFRMNGNSNWTDVVSPNNRMTNGEAFWIKTRGPSDYCGLLCVNLPQSDRMDFGETMIEQTIRIRNASTDQSKNLVLRTLPSLDPSRAGDVPLDYWQDEIASGRFGWTNLNSPGIRAALVRSNVPPGGEWQLRVAVRRRDFGAFATVNPMGSSFQTILEVTETNSTSGSSRWLIPVSAKRTSNAGLWVGTAAIDKVSEPAVNTNNAVPTASIFRFNLIVHVDQTGHASLLQKVLLMWKDGEPADPGRSIPATPGRYVLLTDENLSAGYRGSTLRDGQEVGRRLSSAAFSFRDPLMMTGTSFGAPGSEFMATTVVGYNDPLNPFKHLFHPDHNNLDEEYNAVLPPGLESYTVSRTIRLQFSGTDPDGGILPGFGDGRVGGVYRESIAGLHKNVLEVQGTFRLRRISQVAELTTR